MAILYYQTIRLPKPQHVFLMASALLSFQFCLPLLEFFIRPSQLIFALLVLVRFSCIRAETNDTRTGA